MSARQEQAKVQFKTAYMQMVQGCSNTFCPNHFCKTSLTQAEVVSQLLKTLHSAPEQDLNNSEFVFCEEPVQILEKTRIESLDGAEIIEVFKDLKSLGSNFVPSGKERTQEIDWTEVDKFYKRVRELETVGVLKSKWLEACVTGFQLSKYQLQFLPKAALIVLAYPPLADCENSEILIILSMFLSRNNLMQQLSQAMDTLSISQVQHINSALQQLLSITILQNLNNSYLRAVNNILLLLEALYNSNERTRRIPFTEFYNDAANKEINLKTDFKMWYKIHIMKKEDLHQSPFVFSFFPWIFDAHSKSELLAMEILEIMRMEIRNSAFLQHDLEIFVHLEVKRDNLIQDTLSHLLSGELNLRKPLKVHFLGEEGVDEGGVKKEFFQLIVKELFDPEFSMFNYYQDQRFYWFNPNTIESDLNFELIGMILGMAIYNSIILDVHLPMAAYKKILSLPTDIEDLQEFNPELAKGLKAMLSFEGNVEEVFCKSFYLETEAFGEIVKHPLKEGGENIPVTNENREEYVRLYVDWWLNTGVERIFEEFKSGFLKICKGEVLKMFKPQELELLICGNPVLDFKALESVAKYEGYQKDSITIRYFWEIIHGFNEEEKRKFLCFVTGSDRAPINGLGHMDLIIAKNGEDTERLMTAHTCFNYLLLPNYQNKEKMLKLISTAINNAAGFGLR